MTIETKEENRQILHKINHFTHVYYSNTNKNGCLLKFNDEIKQELIKETKDVSNPFLTLFIDDLFENQRKKIGVKNPSHIYLLTDKALQNVQNVYQEITSTVGGKRKMNKLNKSQTKKTNPKLNPKINSKQTKPIKSQTKYTRTEDKISIKTKDGKTRRLTVYIKGARGIRYYNDGKEYKLCSEAEKANKGK